MKKFFSLAILFVLVFVLAACGGKTLSQVTTEGELSESESESETESATVKVTFPEGYSLVQIAERLEENGVCTAADFIKAAQDVEYFKLNYGYDFLDGIDTENTAFHLEGYIFPATYEFYRGEKPQSAVNRFLSAFSGRFSDEMKAKAEENGMSVNEVVALASIIQKECGFVEEMKNVSSVFVNRIKSASYGKLQSDVTINYVNDYITDSPYLDGDTSRFAELYNTYKCTGLPAGAICCPGLDAINAALDPAETPYYFFVTDKDMNYFYAETYEKHLENCTECGIY